MLRQNGIQSVSQRSLERLTMESLLGSSSNDDGDGRKATGLDYQNNNFKSAGRFLVHFYAVDARLRRAL